MHVYLGRLNWLPQADNETFTIVFPGGLGLQDPVCAYWQWSMTANNEERVNSCQYGLIKTVTKTSTQYNITFACQDCSVDAEFTADLTSMTMKMYDAAGAVSSVSTLQKQMSTPSLVPSTKVFTGKVNWNRYAINEMVTLVVPNGVADGAKVGLYFQFTTNWGGAQKSKVWTSSTFHTVAQSEGQITASFDSHFYKFDVLFYTGTQDATVAMREGSLKLWNCNVQQTDWRQTHRKKALIVRYGTGDDKGIFVLRDMLTTDLDFGVGDVDMHRENAPRTYNTPNHVLLFITEIILLA